MNPVVRAAHAATSALVRNRTRLPRFVNRMIDDVAKNPDGRLSRLVSLVLGGSSGSQVPPPTTLPDAPVRVFIGPTNYAGQGYLWARALEATGGIGARNLAVDLPGGFAFPADTLVPVAVYNRSRAWQGAELAAVERFSHALIEAERPLFGSLFGRDVARELDELQARGLSCAFLCHGTEIRSPAAHAARNRWSPFAEQTEETRMLQRDADANRALLEERGLPIFFSTPDLVLDVPSGSWCPVVVDVDRWTGGRELFSGPVPVVTHIPSMGSVKGTQLIEPALRELHESGIIEYRSLSGVPSSRMPALVGDADIVLDQFRIGSYGVAAVEAMAAGRVVVGHVLPEARETVRSFAGTDLPIVEADPDTLRDVLLGLLADRAGARDAAAAGVGFAGRLHSGRASADVLRSGWIERP